MKSKCIWISVCVCIVFMLVGCYAIPNVITTDMSIEKYYKKNPTPPSGYGRIYIIPGTFGYFGQKIAHVISIGNNKDSLKTLSFLDTKHFIAFDAPVGRLDLNAKSLDSNFFQNQSIDVVSGKTQVLQFHQYGDGAGLGLIGVIVQSAINESKPVYDVFEFGSKSEYINSLALAGISPAALSVVKQEIPASDALPISSTPTLVPVVLPTKTNELTANESPNVGSFETLKKLYDSGLISKDEYEAKKKHLLEKLK